MVERGSLDEKCSQCLSKHLKKERAQPAAGVFVHHRFLFICSLINMYTTEAHQGDTFDLSRRLVIISPTFSALAHFTRLYPCRHVDLNLLSSASPYILSTLSSSCASTKSFTPVFWGRASELEGLNPKEERSAGRYSFQRRRAAEWQVLDAVRALLFWMHFTALQWHTDTHSQLHITGIQHFFGVFSIKSLLLLG